MWHYLILGFVAGLAIAPVVYGVGWAGIIWWQCSKQDALILGTERRQMWIRERR